MSKIFRFTTRPVTLKVTGRTRHLVVDTLGLLLTVVVHPADVQDRDGACQVQRTARRQFAFVECIFADAGYFPSCCR